jgi:hypothetical protein
MSKENAPGPAAGLRGVQSFVPGLRPPFSLKRTVCVSAAAGGLFPLLLVGAGYLFSWEVLPALSGGLAVLFLFAVYSCTDWQEFRTDLTSTLLGIAPLTLFALGLAGSAWCFRHHVCMGGHMAHPPYPAWHYFTDAGWSLCLVVAAFWLYRLRSPLAPAVFGIGVFLVSFRFLFGSLGGIYMRIPI